MKYLFISTYKTTISAWWKVICVSIILFALPLKITAEEVKQKGKVSDNENIEIHQSATHARTNCQEV